MKKSHLRWIQTTYKSKIPLFTLTAEIAQLEERKDFAQKVTGSISLCTISFTSNNIHWLLYVFTPDDPQSEWLK